MLLSLILFGSRARGDHRLVSDVDLLGVVDGGLIGDEVASRGASFYRYPIKYLQKASDEGDLFVLHLVEEGKILHDTASLFQSVRDRFQYKESYESEIREACLVGWFLLSYGSELNEKNFRKRLTWALRTVLIARCAERRTPHFSSTALEEQFGIAGLKAVIDRRYVIHDALLRKTARKVFIEFGILKPHLDWPKSKRDQLATLRQSGPVGKSLANLIDGRKTASQESSVSDPFYL